MLATDENLFACLHCKPSTLVSISSNSGFVLVNLNFSRCEFTDTLIDEDFIRSGQHSHLDCLILHNHIVDKCIISSTILSPNPTQLKQYLCP